MMLPPKLKLAAVPLLLVATVVGAATLGIHNARKKKQARTTPHDLANLTVSEEQPFPYSPTVPVDADLPVPEEYSMSARMQSLLYQTSQNVRPAERAAFLGLPEGAVVLTNPASDSQSIIAAYTAAHAQGKQGEVTLNPDCGLSILTAGPLLQPGDQVVVRDLFRSGQRIELQVIYSQSEAGEKVPSDSWRPVVLVPLLLTTGTYELQVSWWAYANPQMMPMRLEDGKPLNRVPLLYEYRFKVTGGVSQSPVVRADGADFQTLAESPCPMPPNLDRRSLHLGFRITNRSDKDLWFDPRGLGLFEDNFKTADGRLLHYAGGSDRSILARPLTLLPGKSHLFIVRAQLERVRNGELLRLSGTMGSGDFFWSYMGLTPGKYQLAFEYGVVPQPLRPPEIYWTGRVRSGPAEIEIVP
jgi:hypothetical protein